MVFGLDQNKGGEVLLPLLLLIAQLQILHATHMTDTVWKLIVCWIHSAVSSVFRLSNKITWRPCCKTLWAAFIGTFPNINANIKSRPTQSNKKKSKIKSHCFTEKQKSANVCLFQAYFCIYDCLDFSFFFSQKDCSL